MAFHLIRLRLLGWKEIPNMPRLLICHSVLSELFFLGRAEQSKALTQPHSLDDVHEAIHDLTAYYRHRTDAPPITVYCPSLVTEYYLHSADPISK